MSFGEKLISYEGRGTAVGVKQIRMYAVFIVVAFLDGEGVSVLGTIGALLSRKHPLTSSRLVCRKLLGN